MNDVKVMRANGPGILRILLPHGAGVVEIRTGLHTADGRPRIEVDVASDTDRYGTATDGWDYVVENAEPGVVWLTGKLPEGER